MTICRIWLSESPPSIIDEGNVLFLMSLPQMKNLGVSLNLRRTPQRIVFNQGFLKGQEIPLHRNRSGHLILDVKEFCRRASAWAKEGRQLDAASNFPATVNPVPPTSSANPLPKCCYFGCVLALMFQKDLSVWLVVCFLKLIFFCNTLFLRDQEWDAAERVLFKNARFQKCQQQRLCILGL